MARLKKRIVNSILEEIDEERQREAETEKIQPTEPEQIIHEH